MKITRFCLGRMQTNCYLIENKDHSIIIDPGDNANYLLQYLNQNSLKLTHILLTHGHFDHIGAVDYLCQHFNCQVYIHEKDKDMVYDEDTNLSHFDQPFHLEVDVLPAQEEMDIEGLHFKWLHLPGHTPGSSMICLEKEHIIFSGDVLFKESIGRYDFPRSSIVDMRKSLDYIKKMEGDYKILPGHGEMTSLKYEKEHNLNLK